MTGCRMRGGARLLLLAVVTCVHRGKKSRFGCTCTVNDVDSLSFSLQSGWSWLLMAWICGGKLILGEEGSSMAQALRFVPLLRWSNWWRKYWIVVYRIIDLINVNYSEVVKWCSMSVPDSALTIACSPLARMLLPFRTRSKLQIHCSIPCSILSHGETENREWVRTGGKKLI